MKQLTDKYDQDQLTWRDKEGQLQERIKQLSHSFKLRVPFDPFSQMTSALNVTKCDVSVKRKQIETLEKLQAITDPLQQGGLPHAFETLSKSLRNQFDGSMPVFEYQEGDASAKKFVVYFERVSCRY